MLRDDSAGRHNRMQDVYTFAGIVSLDHIAIYVNLYTRIRAIRPSTCNIVRNAFGHLIEAPHYFPWIDRIHIRSDDRFSLYYPHPHPWPEGQGHGLVNLYLKLMSFPNESCLINSILFPRIKSNQLTSHKPNLNDNNKITS